MMYWGYGAGGGWIYMLLGMALFWTALIVMAVLAYRAWAHRDGRRVSRAEHILAERYAKGEIDDEEFEHRSATLRSSST
ncbi:MAG TPA: SHOCT domain-containing protein [Stackebrandtia sp.]|jgi:putative membrane protein|uniref:SHOCT domain-containing protein n=1 Tax=Stackebrandtia sp. TaxID=2023065 RepID=UPI002D4ECDAC|nr:SHOCT domain-containing protein [Stackebrandtia sp.]HZE39035.1 SHOCT domain-containing protein [Stackebrandtia sp.]